MSWNLTDFDLSPECLRTFAEVQRLIGRLEGLNLSRPVPKLRAKNRARSVRGSTGIEGNRCSVEQVEAVARGETVSLSQKEQLEIRNALEAYAALPEFDPFSVDSFLTAHKRLMGNGLDLAPGRFRNGPVEVYITETETRAMPAWETVEPSMRALFEYLKTDEELILIKSIRFHFECVNIHPFFDGNGRAARLWQTRLLMESHPVFEFLDVESMVFEQRDEYYRHIRAAQECGRADGFVGFMLEQIRRSLSNLWKNSATGSGGYVDRIAAAKQSLGDGFSRKDYLQLFKTISAPTASRDLAAAVADGLLLREGDKRTAAYRFA
ncbi:MAG: Fic family protein [Pontiellaceae bacterium]|nr:Fic family protein [Pontiellaceae bacterium]